MNHCDGTYVALELSDACKQLVDDFSVKNLRLSNPVDPIYLHSTIIYSNTPVPEVEYLDRRICAVARALRYKIFLTQRNTSCLTVLLESPIAIDLNRMLTRLGATSEFGAYTPHLTLSYNFTGSIDDLPKIPFDITYDRLIIKPLDVNFVPPSK